MEKQFIAFAGNNNSGLKASKKEAEDWASEFMTKHTNTYVVYLTEVLGKFERQTPPVVFVPVKNGQHDLPLEEKPSGGYAGYIRDF